MMAQGMALMNLGLNFGGSLVPYVTAKIWAYTALGYHAVVVLPCILMALPIPLIALLHFATHEPSSAAGDPAAAA